MTKSNAIINIKGTQTIDGESYTTEIDVVGTIEETENGFVIEYSDYEYDLSGKTVISFGKNGTVFMSKFGGEFSTEMYFENGTRQNCEYSTPYGFITVGIYTNEVKTDLSPVGGRATLNYNIDFNTGHAAENLLEIVVSVTDS